MSIGELTSKEAVEQAVREYDERGRDEFLAEHEFGKSTRYYVRYEKRLYDAKAIAGVAYGHQFPDRGTLQSDEFNGGEAGANSMLRALGFMIIDSKPTIIADELSWRLAIDAHLHALHGNEPIPPSVLRSYGVYGGAQGVWVDANRTRSLDTRGITVGVLHTGLHYADDLSDDGALYHYPHTNRPPGRDRSEVDATKAAAEHQIPVFVISHPTINSTMRQARLGWVEGWEDSSELFLISFAKRAPAEIIDSDRSDETEFHLFGNRSHRAQRTTRVRPDQPRFKITVFQRYGPVCVLSGIHIVDMLEAAHLVPVPRGGSDDPRNGLPLNAALHRAFDADWFAIHPDTLQVCTVPGGPSLAELGIVHPSLAGLANPPHRDALQWRYENWCRRHTSAANNVRS